MDRDHNHPDEGDQSHHRQRARDRRWRLLPSHRQDATEAEALPHQTPQQHAAAGSVSAGQAAQGRPGPDPRWAFATPEDRVPSAGLDVSERGAGDRGDDTSEGAESLDFNDATGLEHSQDDVMDVEMEEPEAAEEEEEAADVPFDASAVGLKEISNLASFTVSSHKPGCGVAQLRDENTNYYWQSDGPQPHDLNIHFIKRVEIRALRIFLDYELDESYTPTKIAIVGGFSPNMVIPFTTMELTMPKGWIDIPIAGAGGGADGNSMCCFFVRITVLENHQNGKDTHIRGVKVYALDDAIHATENNPIDDVMDTIEGRRNEHDDKDEPPPRRNPVTRRYIPGDGGLTLPDFMREPEIR